MITRKENILVRPFQHRKYIEHRKKVSRALPRIDDVTPQERNHVYIKCKKLQYEAERHAQIERDNFILLKHLNRIMNQKRVDNFWLQEHPTFLHRIKLYGDHSKKIVLDNIITETSQSKTSIRNQRCMACNPNELPKSKPIPEERVPWESKVMREDTVRKQNRFMEVAQNPGYNVDDSFQAMMKYKPNRLCRTADAKVERASTVLTRPKPLLKLRSRTESNFSLVGSANQKSVHERPLTVVMKFPQSVQVALNASLQ